MSLFSLSRNLVCCSVALLTYWACAQTVPVEKPYVPKFSRIETPAAPLNRNCNATYPLASQRAKESGTVKMRLEVAETGRVIAAQTISSTGYANLDTATLNLASTCKFKPADIDGYPVKSSRELEFQWRLDKSETTTP